MPSNSTTAMSEHGDKRITMVDFRGAVKESAQLNGTIQQQQRDDTKKKNYSALSKKTTKVIRGGPKNFGLAQISENHRGSHPCIVRYESPWDTYRGAISCIIAGKVTIATHRSNPSRVIAFREYNKKDVGQMVELYDRLHHQNILSAQECFINEGSMFALVDDLPLTLEHLVGCRTLYPSECELASMVWQVCHLLYFKHGRLIYVRRPSTAPVTLARMVGNTSQ
jgi:hypothetical protein